jgi:predicted dehydrogenase
MKAAVIGCGLQGRLHVGHLQRMDDVDVVAVCDLDEARARATAAEHGVAGAYTDYREALAAQELDLVSVCTMPNTHRDVVLAALGTGANVVCEKPFATNVAEAVDMTRAAAEADRLLVVGFNMRFMGSTAAVRRFMAEGGLGTPVCARGFMLADDVPWWGRHYVKALSGGGCLASTAVHMLDLIPWLVGSPLPTTASASLTTVFPRKRTANAPAGLESVDIDDLVFGHLRFDNGFWMSIESSWVWDKPGWNYGFDLVGDRAQASFDPLGFSREDGRGGLEELDPGAPTDVDFSTSLGAELADVVTALRDGRRPELAAIAEEAVVTQAIVDALYQSAALGREVEVSVPAL